MSSAKPTTHDLAVAAANFEYLRGLLLAQYPDLAEDAQTLADTLLGESDLDQMLIAVMRSAEDDAMLLHGLNARMGQLKERGDRLAQREQAKRDIVCCVMERADLKKIEAPDFTLSLRAAPPKVVITDEILIPSQFFREKRTSSVDRAAIGEALKANIAVPGASLSNGGVTLSVRRK